MSEADVITADTTIQSDIEKSFRNIIYDYEIEISKLRTEYDSISASDAWRDTHIKDNFLNTLNNYIDSFYDLKTEMEKQVDDLLSFNNNIEGIESAFSQGG